MANYVKHMVSITGDREQLEKFAAFMGDKFSFNKVIPMPESLNIPSGTETNEALVYAAVKKYGPTAEIEGLAEKHSTTIDAVEKYYNSLPTSGVDYSGIFPSEELLAKEKMSKELFLRLGQVALSNMKEHGDIDWYSWRYNHWGTKWDACGDASLNISEDEITASFNTAWSTPMPVWIKLAKLFPKLGILVEYADEDLGYNCDRIIISDGFIAEASLVEGSDEAFEFACAVWGEDPEEVRAELEMEES